MPVSPPAEKVEIEVEPAQVADWLGAAAGSQAERGSQAETGAQAETEAKTQTGSQTETGTQAETEAKTQTGSQAKTGTQTETGAKAQEDPQVQVIDVREPYEREAGHIAGTRHIEFAALSAAAATVERARPVVFYCRVGSRSAVAAQAFRGAGFQAYSMSGGLVRWTQEGRPLAPADGHVAKH
jgi:rhodanese-related sulfurtransferase